jgi:S-methylmethionine-dependent homocysteine/selenocysteine methylase
MHKDIILLDGGMGQELYRRNIKGDKVLWSANALLSDPEAVRDIHIEFIEAGADVITLNTYCTHPGRLNRVGKGEHIKPLNDLAGNLANEAREKSGRKNVKLAASIPPQYSYRPDIKLNFDEMHEDYLEMVELLDPYVDIFLCETMTNAEEARAATSACVKKNKPVWCAWTCKDDGSGLLRSDETIPEVVKALDDLNIDAFMANCCAPHSVEAAIKEFANYFKDMADNDKPSIGGFANGFTPIPPEWDPGNIEELGVQRNLTPEKYAEQAINWTTLGAQIIGGCCEITPAHIKEISLRLKKY